MTDPTPFTNPQETAPAAPEAQPAQESKEDALRARIAELESAQQLGAGNQQGPNVTATNPEAPTQEPAAEVDLYADPTDPNTTAPEPGTVFYCPACGKRVAYRQQCTGNPVAPHPPVEVVDARELWNARSDEPDKTGVHTLDPDKLTAAPHTDNLG